MFCPPIAVFDGKKGWQAREQDLLRGLAISVECDEHPDETMQRLEEILGDLPCEPLGRRSRGSAKHHHLQTRRVHECQHSNCILVRRLQCLSPWAPS